MNKTENEVVLRINKGYSTAFSSDLTLMEAIEIARSRYPGKVISAKIKPSGGNDDFSVKIIFDDLLYKVRIDGVTRQIIRTSSDR
ncbi:MAG: hypothetical protein EOP06_19440 [Proteobacteria bacterium]|nr:MAG: hypothetical protein EOP06_19440 [Pseudomonadota bacterium]